VMVNGETAGSSSTEAVYVASDIVYYEEGHDFTYGEGIASDAHSPYMRTPFLAEAFELVAESYSFDYARLLFSENTLAVIENRDILFY
ncbi:MAG: hypothetical protein IJN70_01780, partial [Clostridia bacterium]|nr:hypothetical protein [Clostridia bacterium]